jgi:hypothetical protein
MSARPHAFQGAYLTGMVCDGCFVGFTAGGLCAVCENLNHPAMANGWAWIDRTLFRFIVRTGGEARSPKDLTGTRWGNWAVVALHSSGHDKQTKWLCICGCGSAQIVHGFSLQNGTSTQCKRCAAKLLMVDHTGERIGERVCVGRGRGSKWTWRCDCGQTVQIAMADARRRRCRHTGKAA